MFSIGAHHRSVRKRLYKNLEPFPDPSAYKRMLDVLVYVAGILGPLFTIPQIYDIYYYKSAANVSPISWGMFAVFNVVWILYGLVHRERVITITYTLWLIANGSVAVGALMYGIGPGIF